MTRTRATRVFLSVTVVLALVAGTFLFVYNSGGGYYGSAYGYDALEYLVIGRSLNDGFPFYAFIPSKSWALYGLVAASLRLPFGDTHVGISALVTLLLAVVGLCTHRVMAAAFTRRAAWLATALVLSAGVFMELNYLEPEGLVLLSALLGFAVLSAKGLEAPPRSFLVAGLWIGAGAAFKSVALLSALGIVVWSSRVPGAMRRLLPLGAGIAAAVVVPALYFWATGRLGAHVQWSIAFPLWEYPGNTIWAGKLLTKLAWVWATVMAGLALSRRPALRDQMRGGTARLLAWMGAFSLLPLVKTQASHYAFPGAALLLCYSAVAIDRWIDSRRLSPGVIRMLGATGAACLVIFGAAYRVDALARLVTVRDYSGETALKASLARLIPPDRRAIFLTRGTALYWLSDRYPPWPILNTDVQTTFAVARDRAAFVNALDDPRLALVEFDPRAPLIGDARFADTVEGRRFLTDVECRLVAQFDRRDDLVPPLVLWLPKDVR